MLGLGGGEHFGLVVDEGYNLSVDTLENRPGFGCVPDDFPGTAVAFQHQVDEAEMGAPESAHDAGLAGDRALGVVDAGHAVKFRSRKIEMAVTGDDGVDARNGGERNGRIFKVFGPVLLADARMGQGDDDVGAVLAHLRNPGFGRLDDVAGGGVAGQVTGIPGHDLRRDKADQADPDLMPGAGAIGDGAVNDDIRLEEQIIVARIGGERALGQIGADHWEVGAGDDLEHEVEAIVELVIAERAAVITQHIHGGNHRVHVAFLHAALIGDVVTHRISLQEIAIVDEDRVAGLGADLVDDRGGAGQSHAVVGLVAVIIIRKDMHMQVGGFHDAQMRLIGVGARGKRVDEGKGSRCRDAGKQGPARYRMQHGVNALVFHGLSPHD